VTRKDPPKRPVVTQCCFLIRTYGVCISEMLYSHSTSVDGKHVTLHIIDTQGQVCVGLCITIYSVRFTVAEKH